METTSPQQVQSPKRRGGVIAAVVIGVVAIGVIAFLAVAFLRTKEREGAPLPKFPSLATTPDPSLAGSVAYLTEGQVTDGAKQNCVHVIPAAGGPSASVLCWPMTGPTPATLVWRSDGRLQVTAFGDPETSERNVPQWAKLVDVATGDATDVPSDELAGLDSRPGTGPATNPDGDRLISESASGDGKITLQGPHGNRTMLQVTGANPRWSVAAGPVWSPDWKWFLIYDGQRLLLTTVADPPETRVLVDEAAALRVGDSPPFAITDQVFATDVGK